MEHEWWSGATFQQERGREVRIKGFRLLLLLNIGVCMIHVHTTANTADLPRIV